MGRIPADELPIRGGPSPVLSPDCRESMGRAADRVPTVGSPAPLWRIRLFVGRLGLRCSRYPASLCLLGTTRRSLATEAPPRDRGFHMFSTLDLSQVGRKRRQTSMKISA